MLRSIFLTFWLAGTFFSASAQHTDTENIVIITLDGFRWQELFKGADSSILFNKDYVVDTDIARKFWRPSTGERRKTLMPFFWNTIANEGQLYGNRAYHNNVNCANLQWFSYPGYSEMLVGFADREVHSNDDIENPNRTVLEFIRDEKGFHDSVAIFSTWSTMSFITRAHAADLYANSGNSPAAGATLTEREIMLNDLQDVVKNPHGARFDAFTFYYAFEYLKRKRPRVLFISFDETDEHGHGGRYDEYLKSANRTDIMISRLWSWLQSDEQYKDKTTMLITTDHGRGQNAKRSWKSHGLLHAGSGQLWFAVIGPDTPARGEMKIPAQYYQKQIAKTAAAFLGLDYTNTKPVGAVIRSMFNDYTLWSLRR